MPGETDTEIETNGGFELLVEQRQGLIRRFFITWRHLWGLALGGAYAYVQEQKKKGEGSSFVTISLRLILFFAWPFLKRDLVKQPFPVQFRRRLEMLGPTYIKLGQILSLRDDLLPKPIIEELQNLLDRLPAVSFARYQELIEQSLQRPVILMFDHIDEVPLGSASLAQSHRAQLLSGEEVVLKLLKPGVRQSVVNDTRLLRMVGNFTQIFLSRYQPKRLVDEFCRYTLLEVDLRNEAANAEVFTANFVDEPNIRFPMIYRDFSNEDVMCMEFFKGRKPDAQLVSAMNRTELSDVINLGAMATVQMIFRDGFFHADLHPGNLIIFDDASVGFIDLGMVGRFDEEMQKRMLYYFYSLVMGDAYSAARYLTAMTIAGRGSDPDGFRRAVEDLNKRWMRSPNFDDFSLAQLIMRSIQMAGRFRIQYPGEIILMVKALITLEGVGNQLAPGLDVMQIAGKHVRGILFREFNPRKMLQDSLLILPEVLNILKVSPLVINEGLRYVETQMKQQRASPFSELRGTLFSGFSLLAGAIVAALDGPPLLWGFLFIIAFGVAGWGILTNR